MRNLTIGLATLSLSILAGCTADATAPIPEATVKATRQAIEDGDLALDWHVERAVRVPGCSGTFITFRHVLTALHCNVAIGATVRLYSSGTPFPDNSNDETATVVKVGKRPGTSGSSSNQDLVDDDGLFADFAILTLDAPVRSATVARMAWTYPGDGAFGEKVGNGGHEDNPNLWGILMRKYDYTWTSSDSDGPFRTEESAVNDGDSGGPFYYQSKILGVLNGWDTYSGVQRARYTSIARHLAWILDAIDYTWPGTATVARRLTGATQSSFSGKNLTVCQYACDKTSSCDGYNYSVMTTQCTLLSSVTGSTADPLFFLRPAMIAASSA